MPTGRMLASILCALVLPALAGCGDASDTLPPPSAEGLAAVAEDPGAPRQEIARATDALFAPENGETRALVVMHGGKIAAERYGPGFGPDTRLVSWSMAKTVTGVLIGMLVADGRLELDGPVPIARWQRAGDPRGGITLRHLLQMRSGLRHNEAAEPIWQASEVRMLFLDGRDDMAHWAEDQPLEARPGAEFAYSTATSMILADIAARALAPGGTPAQRREAVDTYLRIHLFRPLGMTSAVAEYDASGTLVGGSLIHATARDWAKFGELLRHKGSHRGQQLVPRQWIEFMERPSPKSDDYGAQIWIDAREPERTMLFDGRGPKDTVAAIGHLGQYILVSPRQKLTVVRLGHSDAEQRRALLGDLRALMELYPAR